MGALTWESTSVSSAVDAELQSAVNDGGMMLELELEVMGPGAGAIGRNRFNGGSGDWESFFPSLDAVLSASASRLQSTDNLRVKSSSSD